jgi:DNA/RNA-binding domain of Phe-tRNA-synthetase-like protein
MQIKISEELKEKVPSAALGIIHYRAKIEKSNDKLVEYFDATMKKIGEKYETKDIAQMQHIAPTRRAYKALGKDPHSYRGASEQMLRRVILKKGLYHVNNAVDINNIISVTSGYSIGSYDISEIKGDAVLCRAPEGTHYKGIGKDDYEYNVEFLPAMFDDEGCFGNPSSDSQRTMLKNGIRDVLFVFYAFDGKDGLDYWMNETEKLLSEYCDNYETIDKEIIE